MLYFKAVVLHIAQIHVLWSSVAYSQDIPTGGGGQGTAGREGIGRLFEIRVSNWHYFLHIKCKLYVLTQTNPLPFFNAPINRGGGGGAWPPCAP